MTNKHVVKGADKITAICHFAEDGRPSGKFVACNIVIGPGSYIEHPDANVDLCAIPIGDILNQAYDAGTPLFFQWIDHAIIPAYEGWQYFDAIEEVTMIGCPNGISDEVNNLPIVRRGITASALSKNITEKKSLWSTWPVFLALPVLRSSSMTGMGSWTDAQTPTTSGNSE